MFERDNSPPGNKCCFKPLEEKDFEELNGVRDQIINGFDNHATTGKCRTAEFVFGSVHVRCLSQECGLKNNIKKKSFWHNFGNFLYHIWKSQHC